MGLQPIDLQNMYSQLSNVAKAVAGQEQTAQINASIQQQTQVEKNKLNLEKIQKTNEKSNTGNVNENGHKGSSFYGQQKKKSDQENDEENYQININSKDSSYIGTIIDITR